ncbi:MAG: S41 family peptidase [Rhodospirillaceae bacterium]|nr:S41 family peptidase [Rhodospirillaceae bacterium]
MARHSLAGIFALVLVLGTACAESARDQAEIPDRPPADIAASDIYRIGFRYIRDRYVRPVTVRDVALSGLKGLSSLDSKVTAAGHGSVVTILYGQRRIGSYPAPQVQDYEGWARLTVAATRAASGASPAIAKLTPDQLQQAVLTAGLSSLDPFSRYVSPTDARESRAMRNGYGGIGITVQQVSGQLKVVSVMPGTPAEAAGLRADDSIVRIAGRPTLGLELREIVQRLRGPEGSRVVLTISRMQAAQPLDVTVVRRHIIPVAAVYRREGNAAYIQITRFLQGTARQVARAVATAKREIGPNMSGIILDLRDDPGGLLDQAIDVSDLFLSQGRIVSTNGRHPESKQTYDARAGDIAAGLPIVVLVNGRSASSSEIVAAALQDNRRAIIVGSNSYGKGTVQTVFTLPNEGELILTWSRFHAPSGYALQGLGVMPNLCTSRKGATSHSVIRSLALADHRTTELFRQWRAQLHPNPGRAKGLRAHCAADSGDAGRRALDLQVAKALLAEPALYQRALVVANGPQNAYRTLRDSDLADPDEQ